jgi:CHAT domain-containing protein
VNPDGSVQLTGSGLSVQAGDVAGGDRSTITGQNISLAANRDLTLAENRITATGNLSLFAAEQVRLRDSSQNPLVTAAGGSLTVQGNRGIDIFALNHPSSALFAGGNLLMRSSSAVGGDAHYYAGRDFRIETLDGQLGGLFSPYDPIIVSFGDVSLAGYTGASLHILAVGRVTIPGDISIVRPGLVGSTITETVPLSDGTTLAINGAATPTLDIRAGVSSAALTAFTFAPGGLAISPGAFTLTTIPTDASITLGNVDLASGLVYLTNSYQPDLGLPVGSIRTGAITNQTGAAGGNVVIDARGDITLTGDVDTSNVEGFGGNISLMAQGNITTQGLLTNGTETRGNISVLSRQGAIAAQGGIVSTNRIDLTALSMTAQTITNRGTDNPQITLQSRAGGITTQALAMPNQQGTLLLNATGNIQTGTITLTRNPLFETPPPSSSALRIASSGGRVTTGAIRSGVGNINISALNGVTLSSLINDSEGAAAPMRISSQRGGIAVNGELSTLGDAGGAASITLDAAQTIRTRTIRTLQNALSSGSSGTVQVTSRQGAIAISGLLQASTVQLDAQQNLSTRDIRGFNTNAQISLVSRAGSITAGPLVTTGGNFLIDAGQNVSFAGLTTDPRFDIDGSTLQVTARNGSITAGNVSTNTRTSVFSAARDLTLGNVSSGTIRSAGEISLSAGGIATAGNLNTSTGGNGGAISVSAGSSFRLGLLDSSGQSGSAGDVTLTSDGSGIVRSINAQGGSTGNGGTVNVTTDGLFRVTGTFIARDRASASISSAGGRTGGAITIRHGGNDTNTIFTVGNARINGTAGRITTGATQILPTEEFPYDTVRGNIQILNGLQETNTPTDVLDDFLDEDLEDSEDEFFDEEDEAEDLGEEETTISQDTSSSFTDQTFQDIESDLNSEFEDFLDLEEVEVPDVESASTVLSEVQNATNIRPALMYVTFAPATISVAQAASSGGLRSTPQDSDLLELVMVTQSGTPVRKRVLGVTRGMVREYSQRLLREVTDIRKIRTTSYRQPAEQLYRWLIAPVEADLRSRQIGNIAFILDSGLRSLPLASLYDGKEFLIEKYSIGLMPSLSLTDARYSDVRQAEVLAMGADEFQQLDPLPAVPTELRTIAEDLWRGEYFLNQTFTTQNLREQRQRSPFGIVHLATHGEFRPGAANNSFIQFWNERVQLDQIRQLNFNNPPVRLLVLSACRTAVGDANAELGFAGFAIKAGAQSALASLWYVSDRGTLALMTEFYRQLRQAPIKAEALRRTQLAMLRGQVKFLDNRLISSRGNELPLPQTLVDDGGASDVRHPYFWAAFTMIGSPW